MARRLLSLVVALVVLSPAVFAQAAPGRQTVRDLARELACGPQAVLVPPEQTMRVIRGEDEKKALFGTDEVVITNGGTAHGVKVGQEYFVRRRVDDQFAVPVNGLLPIGIRTVAWARIVDASVAYAVARITFACDGVIEGDFLEPFVRPVVPVSVARGEPDYASAGFVIMGNERRQTAATGDMVVLDRGAEHGLRPGQRLTVFRDTIGGSGPVLRIGEATALVVKQDMSVVRIESSRDAIFVGDRMAPQK
jgi:hypothetical protein